MGQVTMTATAITSQNTNSIKAISTPATTTIYVVFISVLYKGFKKYVIIAWAKKVWHLVSWGEC